MREDAAERFLVMGYDSETAGVTGITDFTNRQFEGSQQAAISIGKTPMTGGVPDAAPRSQRRSSS